MTSDGRVVVVWQPSEPGAEGMIRAAVVGPGREVKIDTLFVRTPGALLSTLAPVAVGGRFAFVGGSGWTARVGISA